MSICVEFDHGHRKASEFRGAVNCMLKRAKANLPEPSRPVISWEYRSNFYT